MIATKVPAYLKKEDGSVAPNGKRETILEYCEISLKLLNVECIDLYYMHRMDTTTPIEETVGAFKELIMQGKIKAYGLSEVGPNTIRRANAVHPCAVSNNYQCVQEEWSLWSRDIETNGVLDVCRELGISIVAYSPLGRYECLF